MTQCYLCHSNDLTVIQEKLRHGIERKVLRCAQCGLVFLDPQKKDLQEFYKKEYRKLHSPVLGKEVSAQEFFDIYAPLQKGRVEKIKHVLHPEMRVLDIGSSAGMFLNAVRPYVKECVGVEFDEIYAQFANEKVNIKTYTKPLEQTEIEPYSFDMISALEVLEHIEDPVPFLQTIKHYLKPDGFVYIEVPNHDDSLLSVFDVPGYREFYYREPHIFYYNPKTLMTLFNHAGFEGTITSSGFEPTMLNQFNWITTGKPQPTATAAYGQITLSFSQSTPKETRVAVEKIFDRLDQEYRGFLEQNLRCSHIIFIGKVRP